MNTKRLGKFENTDSLFYPSELTNKLAAGTVALKGWELPMVAGPLL